ncbi:MAG: GGDEF domain-containing protein [Sphingobium sp.]
MATQAKDEGLAGRFARWRLGLLGREDGTAPVAALPGREQSSLRKQREAERRRALYHDIGQFLFTHDLEVTPLNFGLAFEYITGNDLKVEKAVRAILHDRGRLTDGLAETIMANQHPDEITPDSLALMLDQVEARVESLSEIADQSSNSAKDYGAALQREATELAADSGRGDVIAKLVAITRTMIDHSRDVETRLREGQAETHQLQKKLESARRAADQDHLTGLPNRRAFEHRIREDISVARDAGEPVSVAFCDIDHFKAINDTHGHDTGDRVLRFVAGLLAQSANDKCHVARHGGEEFVMLFRGRTVAEACKIVDDAREDMSHRNLVDSKTGERMEQVTFSGGVADVLAYDEPRDALKAADRALYLAKEHGRNRVYIARDTD